VIAGAEAVCNESGYEFLVVGVGTLQECTRLLADTTHLERRADGVIVVNIPVTDDQAKSLQARRIALSTVGVRAGGAPSVFVDDTAVGHLAATTLAGLGHRRIAMLSGQGIDPLNFTVPKLRAKGFRAGLADAGLTLPDDFVVGGDFGIDGGREATAQLLDLPEPPTAVFAMSDEMAFGALMEFDRRGLRPGVDISILGVDDHDTARVVGLSTIRQDVGSQGATAARALVANMSAGRSAGLTDRNETVMSPIELVLRRTTGPAR
jgi:LacI family repressor for deo operon, udp, cdd, tsx, nupC, and nupG